MPPGPEHNVHLARLFPWLRLLARLGYRPVFDIRKLAIAAVGLLMLELGWSFLFWLFGAGRSQVGLIFEPEMRTLYSKPFWNQAALVDRFCAPFWWTVATVQWSVAYGSELPDLLRGVLALVWMYLVGGIAGGAVCRMIVVEVGAGRRTPALEALRYVGRHLSTFLLPAFCPLILLACFSLLIALFGLIYQIPAVGPVIASIALFIPLCFGLLMTLAGLLLLLGWPFFLAAAAAGADDALDAVSRVFCYLQQKLPSLAIPTAAAAAMGVLGLGFVRLLEEYTLRLTARSIWTSGIDPLMQSSSFFGFAAGPGLSGLIHDGWLTAVQLLVDAWVWSFYALTACTFYLWMREQVDGAPWDLVDRHVPRTPGAFVESPTSAH